ncbi:MULTISPECIES: hypothetical protein [unclassified Isoptericola]|uniref:hypothetical protein n=1 Tax=unclassified Isoptericola TaxID=2623355 RepID=UPI00366491DF
MTRDPLDRVAALAPNLPVDPEGLAAARRGAEAGRADHARRRPAPHRDGRRRASVPWSRLALTAGLATAAAAAVLAVAVVATPGADPGKAPSGPLGLVPAAAAADPSCSAAEVDADLSTPMPRDTWADSPVADVAAVVGQGRAGRVTAFENFRHCPVAVASAVVYAPGAVQGLNVYRDVAAGPLTRIEDLGSADQVTLRGADGWVLAWVNDPDVPRQRLTWIDGSGVRWYAVAEGMAEKETVTLLDALEFDADGILDPASVPAGFESAPVIDPEVGERSTYRWSVEYGPDDRVVTRDADGGHVEVPGPSSALLEVTTPAIAPVEAEVAEFGLQLVDLNGVRAVWTPQGQGGAELRWVRSGVRYRLVAQVDTLDAMRTIARSVEHVDLDDPRLR